MREKKRRTNEREGKKLLVIYTRGEALK